MPVEKEALGTVIQKRFAQGSKSDHEAIWLDCGDIQYVLRRPGGNPFADAELSALIGKRIRAQGTVVDYTFFLNEWTDV